MSQQLLENEIRESVRAAAEQFGAVDCARISQPVCAALAQINFDQFVAVVEAACRKDPALWAQICAVCPPEEACQGLAGLANRGLRAMAWPMMVQGLRDAHERIKQRANMKVVSKAA